MGHYVKKPFEWSRAYWKNYQAPINAMTDEEAGKIIKDVIAYFTSGVVPEYSDRLLKSLFETIQSDIESSRDDWMQESERQSEKGKKSQEKRKEKTESDSQWNIKHF
ncbi:MAG: DUF6291 domain-containing protein [Eubacteriales bacterium]|nr:DUF6291 domain-containing protein [Eubacteriales bacterium]